MIYIFFPLRDHIRRPTFTTGKTDELTTEATGAEGMIPADDQGFYIYPAIDLDLYLQMRTRNHQFALCYLIVNRYRLMVSKIFWNLIMLVPTDGFGRHDTSDLTMSTNGDTYYLIVKNKEPTYFPNKDSKQLLTQKIGTVVKFTRWINRNQWYRCVTLSRWQIPASW